MPSQEDTLKSLREALAFSPENIPLRKHIAAILIDLRKYEEAEKELSEALRIAPNDSELKLGLAEAFSAQGKQSAALVILEELITLPEVIQKYETIRAESNQQFNQIEKIKKIKLLSRNWSEEMGEITSTQKLKRRVIAQNFKDDIEDIYAD